jgi:integrase
MARMENRLTAKKVETATDGVYSDGGNLILRVANNGASRKWVLRYTRDGKVTEIGLGGANRVPLKLARELRDQHMETLAKGLDPRDEKRKQTAARVNRKTFAEVAAALIAERRKNWRANASDGRTSSLSEWTKSLTVDSKPIAGRYIDDISVADIKPLVRPSWDSGHANTARRLLTRIEATFDYAKAHGWRSADNPATWAVFKHILQAAGPTGPKEHHPALEWRDLPAFIAALRALPDPTMAALALEMTILTACRSGEVRGMQWDEISDGVWTIPASRIKRGIAHEVPLSADALALIKRLEPARIGVFVFPGRSSRRPIANWAVWHLVQHLTNRATGQPSTASPHGMRASFRSYCTAKRVPVEISERCLAHGRENAVQAAYDREEMLEDRRKVMEEWAAFLSGADSNVVALRA